MERVTKRGLMCFNVGICAGVTGWWRGREMESFTERDFMCFNVGMCAVVLVGGERGKWKGLQKGV